MGRPWPTGAVRQKQTNKQTDVTDSVIHNQRWALNGTIFIICNTTSLQWGDCTTLNNFKSQEDFACVSDFELSLNRTETLFICKKNNNKFKP
jgi:hypothetical protein